MIKNLYFLLLVLVCFSSCSKDEECPDTPGNTDTLVFNPTPVDLNAKLPSYLPKMEFPADNMPTEEGIKFGRVLFYEPLLSLDGTQSCGTCHNQQQSFTDNGNKFSTGVDGKDGSRNAMQIANLGLHLFFFWDGRASSLEMQAFEPVINPIEMHETWPNVVSKLNAIKDYQVMNFKAFGTYEIDSFSVAKAIAQFERSIISNNSKFDRFMKDPKMFKLTALESRGYTLFISEKTATKAGADCFHCHITILDMRDNDYHDNALDVFPQDSGLAKVTKNGYDVGRFKTPSLRNIEFTAPYMHDGRFQTLEEVIDHYSEGLVMKDNPDILMHHISTGGVQLDSTDKAALKAFLLTLSDPDFLSNPDYSDPNLPSARRKPL